MKNTPSDSWPSDEERVEIARGLLALGRRGQLAGRVHVDADQITIWRDGEQLRRYSWTQARALVPRETQIALPLRKLPQRADPWPERRAAYLRERGR
jgi:hypothetical protein